MKLILHPTPYAPKIKTLMYHLAYHGYTWASGKDLLRHKPIGYGSATNMALLLLCNTKQVVLISDLSAWIEHVGVEAAAAYPIIEVL